LTRGGIVVLWKRGIKAICQILEKGLNLYEKESSRKYPITFSVVIMADRQIPRFSKERWGLLFTWMIWMVEKLDRSELVSFKELLIANSIQVSHARAV
jgi:hypothetical protein